MVHTFLFQPALLDCWACRDLKRFRLVLKGGGGIVVTQSSHAQGGGSKDGGAPLSTSQNRSPGHSWGGAGGSLSGPCAPSEVNRRDTLGRTVLHLIASSTEPVSIDFLTAILSHPSVNLNLQDHENGWTALHRALYNGNLLTALTLLRRATPADVRVKDFEGLTPFDLYNSTIHGTNPPDHAEDQAGELFTWGANRNYTLGVGTSDDRALPDRVNLRSSGEDGLTEYQTAKLLKEPGSKFDRIQVKDVGMSKFATVVLTAERSSNVWVCGIGNTGRIGRAPQTQSSLERLRDFSESAIAIAVGPDHTCIVTTTGDVYTFGFNRFQQLGYALEQGQGIVASSSKGGGGAASTTFGGPALLNSDLDIQISPRKVAGPLKKEHVVGIAAGKLHSAAFTSDALFTWGTNTGQLGYDRAATPTQVVPRKVTAITSSMQITSVAVTDFATACLLESGDVLLLHNDASFFVRFPALTLSAQVSVYRPRQARPKPLISKIVGGPNNAIAAISDDGDLWQFTPEHPSEYAQASGNSTAAKANIKPQLIWSVRKNKKVGAARDVGIGSGQDLILVTESGHVFVRSRKSADGASGQAGGSAAAGAASAAASSVAQVPSIKGKSGWKPVPFLQRVVKVATNESGGLAAIKADARMREVRIRGRSLHADLRDALPHLKAPSTTENAGKDIVGDITDAAAPEIDDHLAVRGDGASTSADESEVEDSNAHYLSMAHLIAEAARRWATSTEQQQSSTGPGDGSNRLPLGCDMFVIAGGRHLPAHMCVVSARLPMLTRTLSNPPTKGTGDAPASVIIRRRPNEHTTMSLASCSFGTALLFLHYLYTDDLPPIWTASIGMRVEKQFAGLKMPASQVQAQLRQLAETFQLQALLPTLTAPQPVHPVARLSTDFEAFFAAHVDTAVEQSPMHDVQLRLSDKVVPCHSVVLRRSPFFSALFQPHWTSSRWSHGPLVIDMTHTRWDVARIVLKHLYTDKTETLFSGTDVDRAHDQFIDFVIEVMAFSNELLLDKFKLVCCSLLRRRIAPINVAAMMTDADFYHAPSFKDSIMDYAAQTMETLLESGMLDDLENRMIKDLTKHVRQKQDARLHHTRAAEYVGGLIVKHNDYYFDLDIPAPSLGIAAARVPKRQPRQHDQRTSPPFGGMAVLPATSALRNASSSAPSPVLRPSSRGGAGAAAAAGNTSNDGSMMFSMDDVELDDETGNQRALDESGFALPPPANDAKRPVGGGDNYGSPTATPWKSKTAEAGRVRSYSPIVSLPGAPQDLRSIMAAEQTTSRRTIPGMPKPAVAAVIRSAIATSSLAATNTAPAASSPLPFPPSSADQIALSIGASVKVSQKDRKRQQQHRVEPTDSPSLSSSSTSSPWKTVEQRQTVAPTTPSTTPSTAATPLRSTLQSAVNSPSSTVSPSPSMRAAGPSMGPTFTPTRLRPAVPRRSVGSETLGNSSGGGVSAAATGTSVAWGANGGSSPYASLGTSPSGRADGVAWGNNGSPAHGSPALRPSDSGSSKVSPLPSLQGRPSNGGGVRLPSATRIASPTAEAPSSDVRPPVAAAPPPPPKSFAQIQEEELRRIEALQAQQSRTPKSFAELQEQDRRENEARVKAEEEKKAFERWFEEESRRLKKEEKRGQGSRKGQGSTGKGSGKGGGGGGGGKGAGTSTGGGAGGGKGGSGSAPRNGRSKGGEPKVQA